MAYRYKDMLMDYCFSIPEDQRDFLLECFGLHKEPHQRVPLYNRKPSSIYLVSLAKLFDEDISTHLHFQGPYCNAALFPNEKPNVFGKQIIEREDEEVLLGDWFYNKCTEIKIIKYKRDFQFDEVELIDPGLRKYVWSPFSQRPFFELNNFEGSKRIFDITLQAPFNTCFHCDQRISFERGMSTILIIQTTMESDSQHSAQKPSKKRKKAKEKKSDENFPKHVSMQIPPFSKAQTKKHCSFCRKNGEKAFVYETHNLKGLNGDIICPILSKHRCEICGATGNYAHTKKYCPINVENPVDLPRFRLLANGTISDSHFHK